MIVREVDCAQLDGVHDFLSNFWDNQKLSWTWMLGFDTNVFKLKMTFPSLGPMVEIIQCHNTHVALALVCKIIY
jgi:hypothetical protein